MLFCVQLINRIRLFQMEDGTDEVVQHRVGTITQDPPDIEVD